MNIKILISTILIIFSFNTYAKSTTLSTLNQLSKEHQLSWTVNKSGEIYKQYSLGLIEEKSPFFSIKESIPTKTLPKVLDWRVKDGLNWISPIKNQGYCGSCVAFATVATFEAQINISNKFPLNLDLSEQSLWSCGNGNCDQGWWMTAGVSYLQSQGISDEACFPYLAGNEGENLSCNQSCQNSIYYKLNSYNNVGSSWNVDPNAIKEALQKGPVLASMDVYEDFMYYGGGIYSHVTGSYQGGHAISIIGYNDQEQYWVVKNSWGTSWGESGFFRIKYNDASNIGKSAISLNVTPFGEYILLKSPQQLQSYSGDIKIVTEGTVSAEEYILETTLGQIITKGIIQDNIGQLDTTSLADGRYLLSVKGHGVTSTRNMFTIINTKPKITLSLEALDLNGQPAKDRIWLRVSCSSNTVPLDEVNIVFNNKEINIKNPCPSTRISFRTKMYPNGKYILKALGKVGPYSYFSKELPLEIKN